MKNIIINNLKDLKIVINGREFQDGDKLKINCGSFNQKTRKIEKKLVDGTVSFGVYEDGECYHDDFHLGLIVEIEDFGSRTLPDIFDDIVFDENE